MNPRKLQVQLSLLAIVLWTVAAVDVATPTRLMRSGQIKGTDFVHFYTLARLGAEGRADLFADLDTQRTVQLDAVPESGNDWYPPAYGPQIAIVLSPLGHLAYDQALVAWTMASAAAYVALVALVVNATERLKAHRRTVLIAAIASPAFWNLIIHGQLSVLALASVVAGFVALRSGHVVLCGVAIGMLGYKPPLIVPAVATLALARAWRPLAGALLAIVGQLLAAALVVGFTALSNYGDLLLESRRLARVLIAKPEQMHSLRAFWVLLVPSGTIATALYAVTALVVLVAAAAIWRRCASPSLRMSVLVLSMVLAAPHLYVYDLVVLAPVWVWLVDWYLSRTDLPPAMGRVLYVGFLAPLLTVVSRATHVQISVLCFSALLAWLWRYGCVATTTAPQR
jgi:hypothetical protein